MKNIKTYEEYNNDTTFKDYFRNFYKNDLSINYFNGNRGYLIDLNGVEDLNNLKFLYCHDNNISTLEPIKNLIKLRELGVNNNNLTSLEGIEKLTNLVGLGFNLNEITSLDPIKNLTNLNQLYLSSNKITSLKPIENLTKLKTFHCDHNPIDWVDYIDNQGRTYYIKLPKSIKYLISSKFIDIEEYWEFYDKNQPAAVSRKFNF